MLCNLKLILMAAAVLCLTVRGAHSILDFGAIPEDDSIYAEQVNAQAFMDALVAANYTEDPTEREVVIPSGTFGMTAAWADNWSNITITIDGTIKLSKRHHHWPLGNKGDVRNFWEFREIHNVVFRGTGTIDGQGYMWWVREFLSLNKQGRPKMFYIRQATNIEITGIRFINSPKFYISIKDLDGFYAHDFEIYTDYKGQLELGKLFLDGSKQHSQGDRNITLPWFPLNTDGVDPAGTNILIERLNITNFDDAVAIKGSSKKGKYAQCTENVIVRDCNIHYGVGLTIGSIPANDDYVCVRNVQFLNHKFYHPIKAIYIKTNPGTTTSMLPGSGGEITNILYDNIEIHNPIWWSIYIGPQQQKQPGSGDGPGCMLYPLIPCETQPLIEVRDITLRNIQQYGNVLPPGIIRCNSTNPCTGITFQNVNDHSLWTKLGFNYITEFVEGTVLDSKPIPAFTNLVGTPEYEQSKETSVASIIEGIVYPWFKSIILDHMFWFGPRVHDHQTQESTTIEVIMLDLQEQAKDSYSLNRFGELAPSVSTGFLNLQEKLFAVRDFFHSN